MPLTLTPNYIVLSANPKNPDIGDLRFQFSKVMPQTVSIIAEQKGNTLRIFKNKARGTTIGIVVPGAQTAAQMLKKGEPVNPKVVWFLRILALTMLAAGLFFILEPLAEKQIKFLSFLNTQGVKASVAVIACFIWALTIQVAWFTYSPVSALFWILVLLGAMYGVYYLKLSKK